MVSLPPEQHRGSGGYSQSVIVPFSCFLLRLFPLLHHGPSSWAVVLFYSTEGTARLQLPLGLIYLIQCGILHGLHCGYLLHCFLCLSTWNISFSNLSVSRIVCSTLSSSLLCSVFYHVLHKFSQRHHRLLCQAQLCPAESPFWSHLELCPSQRSPWLLLTKAIPAAPTITKTLSLTLNTIELLLDKLWFLQMYSHTYTVPKHTVTSTLLLKSVTIDELNT